MRSGDHNDEVERFDKRVAARPQIDRLNLSRTQDINNEQSGNQMAQNTETAVSPPTPKTCISVVKQVLRKEGQSHFIHNAARHTTASTSHTRHGKHSYSAKHDKDQNLASAHRQPMNGLVQLPNCQIDSRLRHLLKLTYSSHPDGELEDTEVRERHCQALPAWCPSCSGCGSAYKCNADPGTENPDRPQRVQSRKFPVRSSSAAKLLAGNLEAAVSVEVDSVNNQDSHNEETSIWETEAMLSILPPVTKDNLKELELPAIQNTLSLRIDLCFDHDLYFQRISGLKGEEKRCKANVFYQCLSAELQSIGHGLLGSCKECDMLRSSQYFTMPSRLGAFFSALRDLLELLVPDKDKEDVIAR